MSARRKTSLALVRPDRAPPRRAMAFPSHGPRQDDAGRSPGLRPRARCRERRHLRRYPPVPGHSGVPCRSGPFPVGRDPPGIFPESDGRSVRRRRFLRSLSRRGRLHLPGDRRHGLRILEPELVRFRRRVRARRVRLCPLPEEGCLSRGDAPPDGDRRRRHGLGPDLVPALHESGFVRAGRLLAPGELRPGRRGVRPPPSDRGSWRPSRPRSGSPRT